MGAMASQVTSLTIGYSTIHSGTDQRKQQSSASLAIVWGIHRWPLNSLYKRPVTQKFFPFDDVIMKTCGVTSDDKAVTMAALSYQLDCLNILKQMGDFFFRSWFIF